MNRKIRAAALIAFFAIGASLGFYKKYTGEIKRIPTILTAEARMRKNPFKINYFRAVNELQKQGIKLEGINENRFIINIDGKKFSPIATHYGGEMHLVDPMQYQEFEKILAKKIISDTALKSMEKAKENYPGILSDRVLIENRKASLKIKAIEKAAKKGAYTGLASSGALALGLLGFRAARKKILQRIQKRPGK